jgi:CTP synthase
MVIEYARNVAGLADANSAEFDADTPHAVIATMEEQKGIVAGEGDMGGTMRLGAYPAKLAPGSLARELYGTATVSERHRHRYEVSNSHREQLTAAGLVISGLSPDRELVEFIELPPDVHPYYIATQAHPELKSRPTRPHPLFAGLIEAAIRRQQETQLPVDVEPVELAEHVGAAS